MGDTLIDMTGQRFGRWTVLHKSDRVTQKGGGKTAKRHWHCRCDCGRVNEVTGFGLRQGTSVMCKSCSMSLRNMTHGKTAKTVDTVRRISSTHRLAELEVVCNVLRKVTSGEDTRVLGRHPNVVRLYKKFMRLKRVVEERVQGYVAGVANAEE